jgi:CO/xanthine dehydrogenase FAD-binding subunit
VKPAPFEYARASSLEEAVELLASHGDEAKVLAGGQSLVPLLNMRMARPAILIDITRVAHLDNVHHDGSVARVGALVRQSAFEGVNPLADRCLPYVGHYVTRNRGTVGGSIAHADARAELPLALLALGGSVVAVSTRGRRAVPAAAFFVTHFTTALEPDELVAETIWPDLGAGWGCAFSELALRAGDYALAMTAVALRVEDGRVAEARIALGATIDRPTLLEPAPIGSAITAELAREVGATAAAMVDPADGLHATAAYQRYLTGLLVERALLEAWHDASGGEP